MWTHPDATIRYCASQMILQVHTDALYLNEPKARSTARGHYFLGDALTPGKPIKLNRAVHVLCVILKHVAASAAEAELSSLFLNNKKVIPIRKALDNMGHRQLPTPIHCDNSATVAIVKKNIK